MIRELDTAALKVNTNIIIQITRGTNLEVNKLFTDYRAFHTQKNPQTI